VHSRYKRRLADLPSEAENLSPRLRLVACNPLIRQLESPRMGLTKVA
jgi:hypothetical protein